MNDCIITSDHVLSSEMMSICGRTLKFEAIVLLMLLLAHTS